MNTNQMPAIERRDAIRAHRSGSTEVKKMLQDLYPGFKFNQDPTEWVKSWEDICEAYMLLDNRETNEPAALPYPSPVNDLQRYLNGCHKVAIAVHVLNDGKMPDMCDGKSKHWIWWEYANSGFRFDVANVGWTNASTGVGPRLCFYSRARAEYAGKVLTPIFKEMFGQPGQPINQCSPQQ